MWRDSKSNLTWLAFDCHQCKTQLNINWRWYWYRYWLNSYGGLKKLVSSPWLSYLKKRLPPTHCNYNHNPTILNRDNYGKYGFYFVAWVTDFQWSIPPNAKSFHELLHILEPTYAESNLLCKCTATNFNVVIITHTPKGFFCQTKGTWTLPYSLPESPCSSNHHPMSSPFIPTELNDLHQHNLTEFKPFPCSAETHQTTAIQPKPLKLN